MDALGRPILRGDNPRCHMAAIFVGLHLSALGAECEVLLILLLELLPLRSAVCPYLSYLRTAIVTSQLICDVLDAHQNSNKPSSC